MTQSSHQRPYQFLSREPRLLRRIEAGYPDNPYHNAVHAADVLQTLHVIIHAAQLHVHYLDHLGLLAAYYAAVRTRTRADKGRRAGTLLERQLIQCEGLVSVVAGSGITRDCSAVADL